jgi:hypothetical protein
MKKNTVRTFTETVSVRLTLAEAQRLYQLASTGRRTLSQTLRILLEPLLKTPPPPATWSVQSTGARERSSS